MEEVRELVSEHWDGGQLGGEGAQLLVHPRGQAGELAGVRAYHANQLGHLPGKVLFGLCLYFFSTFYSCSCLCSCPSYFYSYLCSFSCSWSHLSATQSTEPCQSLHTPVHLLLWRFALRNRWAFVFQNISHLKLKICFSLYFRPGRTAVWPWRAQSRHHQTPGIRRIRDKECRAGKLWRNILNEELWIIGLFLNDLLWSKITSNCHIYKNIKIYLHIKTTSNKTWV